jgi:hypothetical protein
MSLRNTKNLKLISAAGAALALTAAVAAPALAAGEETADVTYTCSGGLATPTAHYAVNAPPAKMVAGQTVKLGTTSTLTLNPTDSSLAQGALSDPGPPPVQATQFNATIKTKPSNKAVGLNLKTAKTDFGNNGDGSTTATASGKTLLRSAAAGTFTLKLGDIGHVHLVGFDSSGNKLKTFDFPSSDGSFGPCTNDAGKTTLKDSANDPATIKVVKDSTTTAVTAGYAPAKNQATGTAKVKSHFGLKPTGKVKFTLKKGTHVIKTVTSKLNKKGIAKAAFAGVASHGKYSIVGKYAGNAGLKSSSGKDTFSV